MPVTVVVGVLVLCPAYQTALEEVDWYENAILGCLAETDRVD